jgi:hypothetical protein
MSPGEAARYARQILLVGVGESGQERVLAARAPVGGPGLAHEIATRYAGRAGFAKVIAGPIPSEDDAEIVRHEAPRRVFEGSRAALAVFRATVSGEEAPGRP